MSETRKIAVTGSPASIEVTARFATREEAVSAAAEFPKSYGVIGTSVTYGATGRTGGLLTLRVSVHPNGTTGALNESGLTRVRRTIKKAEALGYEVEFTEGRYTNELTPAEVQAAIAEGLTEATFEAACAAARERSAAKLAARRT